MSQVLTGPLTQKIKDTNSQKKINMEDKKNVSSVWPLYKTGSYLPESSPGAFPFSFCTSLALDRRMEARSLVKDPLLFNLPLVIYRGGVNAQHICLSVQKISKQTFL